MDEPPRLSMRSWPFWPNKRPLLEDRWLSSLHPPASRWLRLIVAPAASLCGLPFLYEWLYSLRSPAPSFEDCRKIAEGDAVKKWWTSTLASGVLNDYVAPEFLSGVLSPPRSIDRIHEISYFYEREPSQRADAMPEWAKGADAWRDQRVFLTVVSEVEAVPPPPVERELSAAEQDAEDYEEMVRLTRDPWWYSVAMHDEGSPRLYNEWLEQRIALRKNITNADAHLWDVLSDTPYNTNWQVEMADMILLPPSRLWMPAKPPNALIPDEALRLTTTWEIRAKDAEPQFVAATLCPRLVKTKEEDVCITINGRPERARSFLWWQNWETRNYVGRDCSGTMLRLDYTGPRGVRDGRPLRGSRIPRLLVGVQGWEGAPVIRDDAVDHYTGPDAWFLRNSGKMQELWVYDHDAIDESAAFSAEQFALEEAKPFTGDYQIGPQDISVATYHTVPPPTWHHEDHESIEEGYVAEKTEFDLDFDDIEDDE